ncbi:PepSY domain-containing protein [Commensalibacter papalotli (ex Botero et al. 2024)]|uniref:PepSY-associated TM region (PiuB) (PUBMED:15124630) n=1 Tax=Commensalibacter papalotli (ex Botero et al. 2024) TaxID=2972766 RepID=A0ABM9HJV5_9PROT|nr:PepSY-associated TM helix domain-containing protein [Commensalibacter papalotli (ex Botero et al. 2024)]CAI3923033.1 PepSY-associated TM region (PiuB) (PUBMED:15124630) [Commensalibacter papalotli (ex Botero et al. 2024)]CAI3928990.1 PepSY-associated TM region (PiuB) (PUBMED:15124630) [Commensalibacter papalotli (ex Botero et al. 2024)]
MIKKILFILTFIHRWGGLIGGWFCFFLVITGTISIFDQEISQWMQPELANYKPTQIVSETGLQSAYNVWQENARKNQFSFVILPSERYPFLQVLNSHDKLLSWQNIEPTTGEVIKSPSTVGGYFFDSLHNNLLMGRPAGDIAIITLSILFFLFILSGFIIHLQHLWKEFFKIRPKASALRFVLDIHLGIGVFFLPFLLMMVISGFLFYAPNYISFFNPSANHYHSETLKDVSVTTDLPAQNLYSLVQKAQTSFHSMPGFILITSKQIRVVQSDVDQLAIMRNYIELDRATDQVSRNINQSSAGRYFLNLMFGLHLARTGGDVLRCIYFIAGVGSAALIATGLLFFSNKRRHYNKKHVSAKLLMFYKLTDGLHVGVIMGALLALLSVFWVNMLVPKHIIDKPFWEVTIFLCVFILSFIQGLFYSFYSTVMKAWQYQIGLFACLCILLPVAKAILFPQILTSIFNQNGVYTVMSITFISIGLIFGIVYFYLQRKNVFKRRA